MRITNQIMTNNTLASINANKLNLSAIEERYHTGKKIQKPSDDPVVAIRALKLRNNLKEIDQYFKRNVPDARSWLQVTEAALVQVTDICRELHTLADQGSQDTLTPTDRQSIVKTMRQYKEQIYVEGNASYAGRFVFTGFKTDTSLSYQQDSKDRKYEITEEVSPDRILSSLKTFGSYRVEDYVNDTGVEFQEEPKNKEVHSIKISYDKLDPAEDDFPKLYYYDESGEIQEIELKSQGPDAAGEEKPFTSQSYLSYKKPDGGANFIADSGEIILSDEAYETLKKQPKIYIAYNKTEFKKGDVRPEHYFDCKATKIKVDGTLSEEPEDIITYKKENQEISYDVSFNQRLRINTQARDSINHEIGRELDGIFLAVEDVQATEDKIAKVDKLLKGLREGGEENKEEIAKLEKLKGHLKTEWTLKSKVMQERFSKSLDNIKGFQDKVNKAISDLGSREVRLNLTETRLSDQQVDFKDLMSNNEDANLTETVVEFNSQQVIYNASLMAASKVVQNTLLDFLK